MFIIDSSQLALAIYRLVTLFVQPGSPLRVPPVKARLAPDLILLDRGPVGLDEQLQGRLRVQPVSRRGVLGPLGCPGVPQRVGVAGSNKARQVGVVQVADPGVLHARLVPGVLCVGRVRDALPRRVRVVGVEPQLPGGHAGGGHAVGRLLARADVGEVAEGGREAVVLGAVGRVGVGRGGVGGGIRVQGLEQGDVGLVEPRGDVVHEVQELLVGLERADGVVLALVRDGAGQDGHPVERPVVAGLRPELLEERAALDGLEGPGDARVVLVVQVGADVADGADVRGSQAGQRGRVVPLERAAQVARELVHLLPVERVAGVGERPGRHGAGLVVDLGEERLALVLAVVVEQVDPDRVASCRAAADGDPVRIATKSSDVLLDELQEQPLVAESEVEQALLVEQRRRQETEGIDAVVEVDHHNRRLGRGGKGGAVERLPAPGVEGSSMNPHKDGELLGQGDALGPEHVEVEAGLILSRDVHGGRVLDAGLAVLRRVPHPVERLGPVHGGKAALTHRLRRVVDAEPRVDGGGQRLSAQRLVDGRSGETPVALEPHGPVGQERLLQRHGRTRARQVCRDPHEGRRAERGHRGQMQFPKAVPVEREKKGLVQQAFSCPRGVAVPDRHFI